MSEIDEDVDVVPATADQAEACAALHEKSFKTAWDAASLARLIGADAATSLIAVTGPQHQVIGLVLAFSAVDEAEILTLAVDPGWRRLGIGTRLIDTLIERLAEIGIRELFLEVAAGNDAARRLYRSLRFAETGRRRGYYADGDDGPEDAVILRRSIP